MSWPTSVLPPFSLYILGPHSCQALGWGLPESPLICSCKLNLWESKEVSTDRTAQI